MAGDPVSTPDIFKFGDLLLANLLFVWTTRMEVASTRRVDGAWYIALKNNPFFLDRGIG
jgi:hypothetical protein